MIFEIRSKFSTGEAFYLQYGCRSQNPRKSEKLKVFFLFFNEKVDMVFSVLLLP